MRKIEKILLTAGIIGTLLILFVMITGTACIVTPTPTHHPTTTPPPVPTYTPTPTPKPSITITPTPTISVTITATPTSTPTAKPTITPTPTPAPTITFTPTPTVTITATPTPRPYHYTPTTIAYLTNTSYLSLLFNNSSPRWWVAGPITNERFAPYVDYGYIPGGIWSITMP